MNQLYSNKDLFKKKERKKERKKGKCLAGVHPPLLRPSLLEVGQSMPECVTVPPPGGVVS